LSDATGTWVEFRVPVEWLMRGACRELSDDALQPVSYTGEGPGGSTYCVNMAAIIRHKRLLVRLCCYLNHTCLHSTLHHNGNCPRGAIAPAGICGEARAYLTCRRDFVLA